MKIKFRRIFLLIMFVATILFISGCSKIKTGPAELGDKVYIQYTATFDKYPKIIYDTTNKAIKKKIKNTNNSLGYKVFILGKDDTLPQDIQKGIVGMKAGEIKKITLKPSQISNTGYDKKNILSEPGFIYDKANIKLNKGDIKYKNNKYVRVKSILGIGKTKKVIFDMNPLETYNNITYNIKLLQIGGSELETK